MEYFRLKNGLALPKVILGTFQRTPYNELEFIENALAAGYEAIDTASFYGNEKRLGDAMDATGAEFLVTSKLWNDMHGYDNALKSFERSESDLGHIDLFLIHYPGFTDSFLPTWKALERLYTEGRVKAIGVSNFLTPHLEKLVANCEIIPMVNQIEANLSFLDYSTINFCRRFQIQLEAWYPLMKKTSFLSDRRITDIARLHHKTPAQIALRFLAEKGFVSLPKTTHFERMCENINIFDFHFSKGDMEIFDSMNTGKRTGDDPMTFFAMQKIFDD